MRTYKQWIYLNKQGLVCDVLIDKEAYEEEGEDIGFYLRPGYSDVVYRGEVEVDGDNDYALPDELYSSND